MNDNSTVFDDLKSEQPRPSDEIFQEIIEIDPNCQTGISSLLAEKQGYIVGRVGDRFLRLNTDAHMATTGPTGSGKGVGVIIPNIIDHPGSSLVIDIRGETVKRTVNAQRLKGHKIVILDPFEITNGEYGVDTYNPLDPFIDKGDQIDSDGTLNRIANALLFDDKGRHSNEPIWDNATLSALKGLIYLCLNFWNAEKQNFIEIFELLVSDQQELDSFIKSVQSILEEKDLDRTSRLMLKQVVSFFIADRSKTKIPDNAIAQAKTNLEWAIGKAFSKNIVKSTFSFEDLSKYPTTVYVVVPEEHISYCGVWLRLILESAVFAIPDVALSKKKNTSELKQDERVLFLLDEFPSLGRIDVISKGMTTLRGRGINIWLLFQNLAQLDSIYGKEDARVIMGNLSLFQAFESREIGELEYFVKLVGETMFDVQTVTIGETHTEGESVTYSTTQSTSNSETLSHTQGTSDTVGESRTKSWNKSYQKNWNKGTGTSSQRGGGQGFGESTTNQKGKGKNTGLSWDSNWLNVTNPFWGENKKSQKGESTNSSTSNSQNKNTNTNYTDGTSTQQSRGGGYAKGKGGSKTKSTSHTDTSSNTHSNTRTNSNSTTHGNTKQNSYAVNKQISVKQERMSIETVRTIREKLSGRNSMIAVNNHSPFFVPRVKFFVKYLENDRYMFPDLASLADPDCFHDIRNRAFITKPIDLSEFSFYSDGLLEQLNKKDFKSDHREAEKSIRAIRSALEQLIKFKDKYAEVESLLMKQKSCFQEVAVMALAMINCMQRNEVKSFFTLDEKLIQQMIMVEKQSSAYDPKDLKEISQITSLPVVTMDIVELTVMGNSSLGYMVQQYSGVLAKAHSIVKSQIKGLNELYWSQELTRKFLNDTLELFQNEIEEALFKSARRDIKWKHEFMMNRYG